ncbi:MAG: hypothetical protein J0I01_04435 [Stenotrophomonas nitritireducens]|uniref:hypothetical protein n=1 Tax=Stenotrophomonas nitritireducens TaxID=83617 RepID=UPI001ACF9AA0|nr:hypothetical protein [Stenotrophomonas nitritireducens]MBN8791458.1 hypothetical protein [Stenotrophomonas nitritireducens]MBN8795397.1 hypothetical protein [Stenotrophomonas nitritireducens]
MLQLFSRHAAPRTHALALCTLAGLSAAATVHAQDAGADAWRFQVTPYVWMTGLDGQVRPFQGAPSVHVDRRFSDLLSDLDAAAFVTGTARRDRFVLQADFSHAAVSSKGTLPIGLPARAKVRQTSLTLTGGYNWAPSETASVDLMGGLRSWDIKATAEVPGLARADSNSSFVDPILAARWRQSLAPRWSSLVYADTGGFGVGSRSTWQLLGAVNYAAREDLHVSLGYRHLSVDYRDDGRRLDFSQSGPMLGVTWLFGKGRAAL